MFSGSYKAIKIQKNFYALKIGAQEKNTAQKRLKLTFTKMSTSYTHNNKESNRINSPLDNIMQDTFYDNEIGVQAKRPTN